MEQRWNIGAKPTSWVGNYSRFSYLDTTRYLMMLKEQGVPVLDDEFNMAQNAIYTTLRKTVKYAIGDGSPDNGFNIQVSGSPDNNFTVKSGSLIVDGWILELLSDFEYTSQPGIAVLSPPASGTRTDEVYLEMWMDEENDTEDSNIVDPTLGARTSCRLKQNFVVKVAQGSTTPANSLGTGSLNPDLYYWRYKLATLTRDTNNPITVIADARRVLNLNYTSPTGALVPTGGIILWSGSVASIPANWHLCDGTNGTPDLRDRFVVGAGNSYAPGDIGGEATHMLTVAEMPAHTHPNTTPVSTSVTVNASGNTNAMKNCGALSDSGSAGGGAAHNNLPPYYALAYIMRIS